MTEVRAATLGSGSGPREAAKMEVESENPFSPLQSSDEEGMLPLTDSESEEEESEPLKSIALSSDSEDDDLREAIRMSLQLNKKAEGEEAPRQ